MHSVSGDDETCRGTDLTSPLCDNFMHLMQTAFYTSSAIGCLSVCYWVCLVTCLLWILSARKYWSSCAISLLPSSSASPHICQFRIL